MSNLPGNFNRPVQASPAASSSSVTSFFIGIIAMRISLKGSESSNPYGMRVCM